ncbi:hypothetical protein [Streptomyces orinoci]|uniref:Uncharacterized protein n=1 Tax=Streptomyces orinoci TaxID=67339 RepID=A0ABV3K2I5_STRON|nr:hypothetical protein [Streptomyces orinoci]
MVDLARGDDPSRKTKLAERLAAGGLVFLGMVDPDRPLIPPTLAGMATSYPESEKWRTSSVDRDAADCVTRANEGWFDLAREGGLFGDDREFLVAVAISEEDDWWARVRLAETWDVMGAGSANALGNGFGLPAFHMLSLTGDVVVCGMVWQSSIGTYLVSGFEKVKGFRDNAEWKANWARTPRYEALAIRRWLESIDQVT